MQTRKLAASVLTGSLLLGLACATAFADDGQKGQKESDDQGNSQDLAPNGKGEGTLNHPGNSSSGKVGPARVSGGNGISYHGGPVMTSGVNVYLIWYGDWAPNRVQNTAVGILTKLAQNLGGSPYYKINTTYYNGSGVHVSGAVTYAGSISDNYSQGKSLTDAQIQTVVATAIGIGKLGLADANGLYFVLTSSDVTASSGFCTQYCGWHTNATINGTNVKYSFVGNPDRCPSACEAQTTSPNGNAGADGMASILSHELEETNTDPNGNAWYDGRGQENGDKCAWTFGTTYAAAGGSKANINLGGLDFLIQQNWVNASGGYCAMK